MQVSKFANYVTACMFKFEPISIMFGIREMECSTEDAYSYCLKNTSEESQSVVMIFASSLTLRIY